jgi:hypothetical protein
MSRPKSLLKEEPPDNVIGEIALYLSKHCGTPGCSPVFHLDNAEEIITIIVDYNKNKKQEKID